MTQAQRHLTSMFTAMYKQMQHATCDFHEMQISLMAHLGQRKKLLMGGTGVSVITIVVGSSLHVYILRLHSSLICCTRPLKSCKEIRQMIITATTEVLNCVFGKARTERSFNGVFREDQVYPLIRSGKRQLEWESGYLFIFLLQMSSIFWSFSNTVRELFILFLKMMNHSEFVQAQMCPE